MAVRVDVSLLPPFDPVSDPTSLSQRWKAWRRTYIAAVGVTGGKQKRALLLYQAGAATQELFDTLSDTGREDDYNTAIQKLEEYFIPKTNVDFEIFQFRQAAQKDDETMDQFVTRLHTLAVHCEFTDLDKELKSTIIQHCKSKHLRRFALREEDLTLDKLLSKARSLEASERQACGMEQVTSEQSNPKNPVNRLKGNPKPHNKPTQCRRCGLKWPHNNSPCPAIGKRCVKCKKLNHFAKMCMSKQCSNSHKFNKEQQVPKRQICKMQSEPKSSDSSDTDLEYIFTLGQDTLEKVPLTTIIINQVPVCVTIDTGASINILDETAYNKITQVSQISLKQSTSRIFAYGSKTKLETLGQFEAKIEAQGKFATATVVVVRGTHGSLLSYSTAVRLGLVDITVNTIHSCDETIKQYTSIFKGIGELKNYEVKLSIDESVTPVAQRPRRVPFHIRKKVEEELTRLEEQGIIERVEGPTPWVSPLTVIPKKNGDIRICVDMREANKAIIRERHPSPTVDDLIHALNGSITSWVPSISFSTGESIHYNFCYTQRIIPV